VDYSRLTAPVSFAATLSGPARFGDGETTISTSLPAATGGYGFAIKPAPGSALGTPYTLTVTIGQITLTRQGRIGTGIYLPMATRH
jgi:hypothetical protein